MIASSLPPNASKPRVPPSLSPAAPLLRPVDRRLMVFVPMADDRAAAKTLGLGPGLRGRVAPAPAAPAVNPTLDKFRALLRERAEEFGAAEEDLPSGIPSEEVVRVYEEVLSDLTLNSKPIITDLTIIAGDHRDIGEGIADAICARILEVSVEQKLPCLYLLDSIVKNIGREYVKCFSARLPEVFCEAYRQVRPSQYEQMLHLFKTWSAVFPSSVLRRIEAELQFSPSVVQQSSNVNTLRSSESPVSRPSHGIHVNPKYLEARNQLERSTVDLQHGKVDSSSLLTLGRKSAAGNKEDTYHPKDGSGRELSRFTVGHSSGLSGVDRNPFAAKNMMMKPSSPVNKTERTFSPSKGRYSRDISPMGISQSVSPLRPELRVRGGERIDLWDRTWSGDGPRHMESSRAYNISNGNNEGPRALINAYGGYREKPVLHAGFPKNERFDMNGSANSSAIRNWQSVEEEEYDWEDMSPTLAERSGGANHKLSVPPLGSSNMTSGLGRHLSGSKLGRVDWDRQSQISLVGDSIFTPEDRAAASTGGAIIREEFSRGTDNDPQARFHGTSFPHDSWNPHPSARSSISKSGMGHQVPLSGASGSYATASQRMLHLVDNSQVAGLAVEKLLNARTGIGSSPMDSLAVEKQFQRGPHLPSNPLLGSTHLPTSQLFPSFPSSAARKQIGSQLDFMDSQINVAKPLVNRHLIAQGQGVRAPPLPIPYSGASSSIPPHVAVGSWNQGHGGVPPPLPPVPHPVVSHLGLSPLSMHPIISNPAPGGSFSGIINSLMAQGVISLAPGNSSLDSLGVEFDVERLKARHDSAINALFVDLPRQCTTCGARFKFQEEHSNHMDWHVTKNRNSKNRKQNLSRKWFVSAKEWLSGAEALGSDYVPGFLPAEVVVEKRVDEEMVVPADDNQNVCALCNEPFENFYSDETDEWMYKGAVYMNASDGQVDGMDRSLLGPIVHAKCRSESTKISCQAQDETVGNDDYSQRKRMRSSF